MRKLFIAATHEACDAFCAERTVVDFECADFTTVSAAVMTAAEALGGKLEQIEELALGIPVFAVLEAGESLPPELIGRVVSVINRNADDLGLFGRQRRRCPQGRNH
jgi:ornithine decarboxylase